MTIITKVNPPLLRTDAEGAATKEGTSCLNALAYAETVTANYVEHTAPAYEALGKDIYEFYCENGGIPDLDQLLYLRFTDQGKMDDVDEAKDALRYYAAKHKKALPDNYWPDAPSSTLILLLMSLAVLGQI